MKPLSLFLSTIFCIAALAQVEIDQKVILTGADGNRVIQQLEAPVDGTDAVNKDYVDSAVSGSGGSFLPTMISDESGTTMNFGNAMRYCRDLEEGDFTDWKLPTLHQLLYAYTAGLHPVTGDTSTSYFWVGDYPGSNLTGVRIMRLSDGYFNSATADNSYRVRCVR